MTNEQREQKIRAAIAERVSEGWKIRDCITRDPILKECCPLGALPRSEYNLTDLKLIAKDFLDLPDNAYNWAFSFAEAFDGEPNDRNFDQAAYAIGIKLRQELGLHNYRSR